MSSHNSEDKRVELPHPRNFRRGCGCHSGGTPGFATPYWRCWHSWRSRRLRLLHPLLTSVLTWKQHHVSLLQMDAVFTWNNILTLSPKSPPSAMEMSQK